MRSGFVSAVLASVLLLHAAVALAEDKGTVEARNNQAAQFAGKGEFGKALEIWESLLQEVGPDYKHRWAFHLNAGRCCQKLGWLAEAHWHYSTCLEIAEAGNDRADEWRAEVEKELSRERSKVVIKTGVVGSELRPESPRPGRWYPAPLTWWLKPGTYKLSARASGYQETVANLRIGDKGGVLTVKMKAAAPKITGKAGKPGVATWKWVALGSSAALAVAGGALYFIAGEKLESERRELMDKYAPTGSVQPGDKQQMDDEWEQRKADHVTPYEVAGYALWGAAGVGAAVSAVLIYSDLSADGNGEAKGGGIRPLFLPGGGGVAAEWTF